MTASIPFYRFDFLSNDFFKRMHQICLADRKGHLNFVLALFVFHARFNKSIQCSAKVVGICFEN